MTMDVDEENISDANLEKLTEISWIDAIKISN